MMGNYGTYVWKKRKGNIAIDYEQSHIVIHNIAWRKYGNG